MKIKSIMNPEVSSCSPEDSLYKVAQIMWDRNCGGVPVTDADSGKLEGFVTDRDLCMAALLSNRPPELIPVSEVMASEPTTCTADDDLRDAHATMRDLQIRRLPVVDDEGQLVGLLSLSDIAIEAFGARSKAAARRQRDTARTLAAICEMPETNGQA